MDPQPALDHRTEVEAFQRKHRTALLTLLFTDLVGSTRLKQDIGDSKAVALMQQHHALLRDILARFTEAEEISTSGDSFFLVFTKPSDAVKFSLLLQTKLRSLAQDNPHPLLDRIGIHVGEVIIEERPDAAKPKDLYGIQVDACARVMSLAEADQILLTRAVFDNARQVLKGEDIESLGPLSWLNHGPYLLKGLEEPLEICEVGETATAPLKPPPDTDKVHRHVSPDSEPVLGWRPAIGQSVPNTRWTLEEKLGQGGFGEVWLGRHETLKEHRVFKFCFHADRVRSLRREVTLFRVLKEKAGVHPHIVTVEDVYFDQPPYYLMMEYVPGRDLPAWCAAQGGIAKVPMETRLEIVAQMAEALQVAHEAGVIHRDVKPSNILIADAAASVSSRSAELRSSGWTKSATDSQPEPQAKLTDFGIGLVVSQEVLAGMTQLGFTQTMMTSGTQSGSQMYMAPELSACQPASPHSDLYSLGVVLYQLLVGDFARPVTTDWAKAIDDPLLREDLQQCFAGDVKERFASAGQLGIHLRSLEHRRAAFALQEASVVAREDKSYQWGIVRTAAFDTPLLACLTGGALYFTDGGGERYDFASAYHISSYVCICVVVAMYFGVTAGMRAFVRDRAGLLHQGMKGSQIATYILKRTRQLTLFVAMQCALFVSIGNGILEIRGMFPEYLLLTSLTGLSGISLGMLFSSLIRSKEGAVRMMWLVMIPQLVFGGALRDDSKLHVPWIYRFIATSYSYEALIVAQAKLNPLTSRQDQLLRQTGDLLRKEHRTDAEAARLKNLKDTLALLSSTQAPSAYEIARLMKYVDEIIDGKRLDTAGFETRPDGITAERLYINRRVTDLVKKAETEQNDERLKARINTFFSAKKHYGLSLAGHYRSLTMTTVTSGTLALLVSSFGCLMLLYGILRWQIRSKQDIVGVVDSSQQQTLIVTQPSEM